MQPDPVQPTLDVLPVPPQIQRHSRAALVQVTPPFRMYPSPAAGVLLEQFPEHPCIPGKCFHGDDSEVPEFESDPLTKSA